LFGAQREFQQVSAAIVPDRDLTDLIRVQGICRDCGAKEQQGGSKRGPYNSDHGISSSIDRKSNTHS
jgi:hypothetical protein